MAKRIGKQKVSQSEYDNYVAKLNTVGGTITGNLTLSSETSEFLSHAPLVQNGEVAIQVKNGSSLTSVLQTINAASELSIFNNQMYISPTGIGVGQTNPKSTFHIGSGLGEELRVEGNISSSGTIINDGLPTSDPGISGSLFITGSTSMELGGITGSGTFQILCVSKG